MDEADMSDERISIEISQGIEKARAQMSKRVLEPCGSCYYCNEYVSSAQLFCSNECADDYEKMKGRYP